MKKSLIVLAAAILGGCATSGDVDSLRAQLEAQEEMLKKLDKDITLVVNRLERAERDVQGVQKLIDVQRNRLDALAPTRTGAAPTDDLFADLEKEFPADKVERVIEYLKSLSTLEPSKALESGREIGKFIVPKLVRLLREPKNPAYANAVHVLSNWPPGEAAPMLDQYLADGSIRNEALRILDAMPPHEAVRKALLANKDLPNAPLTWKVQVANALVRAHAREGVRELIQLLYAEENSIRVQAIDALKSMAGFDLGYKPYAGLDERKAAARKWEDWWSNHEAKFEFPRR